MKILHISAECYPAAKAGGLGDVVGALPKYLNAIGKSSGVLIPKYKTKWLDAQSFISVYRGTVWLHNRGVGFTIEKLKSGILDFPLYVANIPEMFSRPGIYAAPGGYSFGDDVERYLSFQQAALKWILNSPGRPQVLHCHDHHTGLIPFMLKYCPEYEKLSNLPTVFTIHNGVYHGAFGWDKMYLLPFFKGEGKTVLDWNHAITPLAAAIKTAWRITTVSPSYLEELKQDANGLEQLLIYEQHKSSGILNGIDSLVWNPKTDTYISDVMKKSVPVFKSKNKLALQEQFPLDMELPLITFIGRLAREKGADLLPALIKKIMQSGMKVAIAILGTGDPKLHTDFQKLNQLYPQRFHAVLEYNEGLAHQLYAGSDFLLMPSRVEPCGLNQMYAMRYGTIPIVRSIGGLKDTVPDIGEPDGSGRGIRFNNFSLEDAFTAVYRAADLYGNEKAFTAVRDKIMKLDFSWEASTKAYVGLYDSLI